MATATSSHTWRSMSAYHYCSWNKLMPTSDVSRARTTQQTSSPSRSRVASLRLCWRTSCRRKHHNRRRWRRMNERGELGQITEPVVATAPFLQLTQLQHDVKASSHLSTNSRLYILICRFCSLLTSIVPMQIEHTIRGGVCGALSTQQQSDQLLFLSWLVCFIR